MVARPGRVAVSGGALAYHRTGGHGPPLVLSHGLTDNGLCWSRLASAFEADFDVIMLDARGHGDSVRLSGPYDPARDLAEAIEGLRLEAPIVMGHSVGARATAAYAGAHPARAVILEDPPLLPPADEASAQARARKFREQVERFRTMSDAEIAAAGRASHPTWHDDDFPAWIAAKRQVDAAALPTYSTPWQEEIDRISVPALLIHGEGALGSLVTSAIAAEAAAINPNIRPIEIARAGHNVRRENFPDYLAAVRAFLSAYLV